MTTDIVSIIGILLIIIGLIFVFVEMIIPGFGAPGILGGIGIVAGVIMTAKNIQQVFTLATVIVVIIAAMMTAVIVFFHNKKIKSPVELQDKVQVPEGYIDTSDIGYLVGKVGVAATDLRPAGKCDIYGVIFDVRSEGVFVKKGTKVQIIQIQGNTPIVSQTE